MNERCYCGGRLGSDEFCDTCKRSRMQLVDERVTQPAVLSAGDGVEITLRYLKPKEADEDIRRERGALEDVRLAHEEWIATARRIREDIETREPQTAWCKIAPFIAGRTRPLDIKSTCECLATYDGEGPVRIVTQRGLFIPADTAQGWIVLFVDHRDEWCFVVFARGTGLVRDANGDVFGVTGPAHGGEST